jgi:hypothetical protein
LHFKAAPSLTDAAISVLAVRAAGLHCLEIDNAISFTDAALSALVEHCGGLRSLYLRNSVLLSGPALLQLLHRCKDLNTLWISDSAAHREQDQEIISCLRARKGNFYCE